jgi:hypothetical protein
VAVAQISALYIYPIKSCGGIPVEAASVERRGLQFDRRFMLVDSNGRFLTQRQRPQMALLATAIDGDELIVSRPDGAELRLPLSPAFGRTLRVKVWRSKLDASAADPAVDAWFSEYIGHAVTLVYMSDSQRRPVSRQRATQPDDEVSFADGAPILLTSEGSLAALNARLDKPVSMRRFRPNIVVDSESAFVEDRWKRIRIAETMLEPAWACARCRMTTVDPDTGVPDSHGEPLSTLREFRRDGPGIMFGQNVLVRGDGMLRIGDAIEVLEWKQAERLHG